MSDARKKLAARRALIGTKALAAELGIPAPSLRRMLGKGKSSGIPKAREQQIKRIVRRPVSKTVQFEPVKRSKKKQSRAASKGWVTRRTNQYEKQGISRKSAEEQAQIPRELLNQAMWARYHVMPPGTKVDVLARHIERSTMSWELFLAGCIERGLSPSQARTIWFSPVIQV